MCVGGGGGKEWLWDGLVDVGIYICVVVVVREESGYGMPLCIGDMCGSVGGGSL